MRQHFETHVCDSKSLGEKCSCFDLLIGRVGVVVACRQTQFLAISAVLGRRGIAHKVSIGS